MKEHKELPQQSTIGIKMVLDNTVTFWWLIWLCFSNFWYLKLFNMLLIKRWISISGKGLRDSYIQTKEYNLGYIVTIRNTEFQLYHVCMYSIYITHLISTNLIAYLFYWSLKHSMPPSLKTHPKVLLFILWITTYLIRIWKLH